jgi:hypothetical protein
MRKTYETTWTMHMDTWTEFVVVNPLFCGNTTHKPMYAKCTQMIHNPTVQQGSIFQVVQQFYQDATLFQFFNIRNRPMAVPYIYGLSIHDDDLQPKCATKSKSVDIVHVNHRPFRPDVGVILFRVNSHFPFTPTDAHTPTVRN